MATGGNAGFKKFAKAAKGTEMTSSEAKKWLTDAGCFKKGSGITPTDLDICFTKIVKKRDKAAKNMKEGDIDALVAELGTKYKGGEKALKACLEGADAKMHGTTAQSKTGNVDRMTDTSLYTGSHQERFDADGKGKGAGGRADLVENTGYVGDYKGKDTFDKKK